MARLKAHLQRTVTATALLVAFLGACTKGREGMQTPSAPSSPARSVKMASELAAEIYRDVYAQPLTDRAEFSGWANVLVQGASIEGVYRGFILSKEYRLKEEKGPRICSSALAYFSTEAAEIKKRPKEEFLDRFNAAPFFAAKRVLGEALLSHFDEIAGDPGRVASEFGRLVERSSAPALRTQFGSRARDQATADSSAAWAKSATLDSIKWEALNRIHRVMNALCLEKTKGK